MFIYYNYKDHLLRVLKDKEGSDKAEDYDVFSFANWYKDSEMIMEFLSASERVLAGRDVCADLVRDEVKRTSKLFKKALKWAEKAHEYQKDKGGVAYINHPLAVSGLCDNNRAKIVALLHDVVEDSDATLEEIEEEFGAEIREAVDALTRREYEARYHYLKRVKANPIAT
ncbi:MAG: HD domain-containing protein, partial [Erysipelotrichaceae bacterium]|nr:HD domain-containing protein [Erysipelotrichaceae bacterium]